MKSLNQIFILRCGCGDGDDDVAMVMTLIFPFLVAARYSRLS